MSAALSLAIRRTATATAVVPRRYTALQRFVHCAALLLAGLTLGLLVLSFGPPGMRSLFGAFSLNAPGALPALLIATAASVIIHELGHLLVAVSLGFEVLGISLGPVRLQWLHGKYAVRFSVKRLFLASIAVVPKDMRNWRRRSMSVAAAGPLATLLTAIAACGMAISRSPSGVEHTFWCALVQMNLFIFVLGLVPNAAQAVARNDAALFRMLFNDGLEAHELELVYLISQLRLHAIRPSDYPVPLMDRLAIHRASRSGARVMAARTMSDWALDLGDFRMADSWDREAVTHAAHCEPRLRNSALAASACLDVVFRGDMNSARAKFASVDLDELFPPCFAHRVRAARLLAIDQPHLAPAEVIRAQYALPLGLDYYDFERMLLEKIHLQALAGTCVSLQTRYNGI
ncbi:MAG TPA: site-2 protease family protein [Bryobacteraceae bacterium]